MYTDDQLEVLGATLIHFLLNKMKEALHLSSTPETPCFINLATSKPKSTLSNILAKSVKNIENR